GCRGTARRRPCPSATVRLRGCQRPGGFACTPLGFALRTLGFWGRLRGDNVRSARARSRKRTGGSDPMLSWLPPSVSTYSGQIDWLFYLIYYITTFTFFAVQITLLVFVFRYRYNPNRRATYTHGNTTLEIVWTVVPAVLLAVLALISRTTWA